MKRTIKVLPEYSITYANPNQLPLWEDGVLIDESDIELPISDELKQKLHVWNEEYGRTFSDGVSTLDFVSVGRELSKMLKIELNDNFHVEYYNELNLEVENI